MMVDTDQKRKTDEESPNKSRAKPKSRTDKETEKKPSGYIKSGDLSNNEPEKTTSQPASSSTDIPIKKKTNKPKREQLTPSTIGIQSMREAFEEARNKDKLSVEDYDAYIKLYTEWKASKGKEQFKRLKLGELKDLYKKVLYRK